MSKVYCSECISFKTYEMDDDTGHQADPDCTHPSNRAIKTEKYTTGGDYASRPKEVVRSFTVYKLSPSEKNKNNDCPNFVRKVSVSMKVGKYILFIVALLFVIALAKNIL